LFKDNYRGITDGFDEIEIRDIPDDTQRINALQAGDVDFIILVPESEIQRLRTEQQGKIELSISREGIFWWFPFNMSRPPYNDPKLRQAIRLAFDAKQVSDAVTLGEGAPYEEPFVTGSRWHFDPPRLPQRDVAKAKEALAAAGYPNGLKLRLLISSNWYSSMTPASQVLQAQLAEAGIQVDIENVEFGTFFDKAGKMDYDMMLSGWEVEPWDPDDYYYNCHMPEQSQWWFGGQYNNPQMQGLVKQARGEQDFAKRKTLYQQVETTMQDDAAGLFGYRLTMGFAWRSNLKGFKPSLRGDVAQATGGIYTMTKS
jgi:ABC-type transport system substrate-binding protein